MIQLLFMCAGIERQCKENHPTSFYVCWDGETMYQPNIKTLIKGVSLLTKT